MGLVGVLGGGQYEAADCALVSCVLENCGKKKKKCEKKRGERR